MVSGAIRFDRFTCRRRSPRRHQSSLVVMSPLSALRDLHVSTEGWSTAALVAVIASIVLVGRIVMLRDARRTWIGEHPLATGLCATVVIILLGKGIEWVTAPLLGVGWLGLLVAVLLTGVALAMLHGLEMSRR
jgi:hypothetical protein